MEMDLGSMDLDTRKQYSDDLVVAVWMVTYNHQDYIVQAVESVMRQKTNFRFKLFIGEDFSTDNTLRLLQGLLERNSGKIELIVNTENVGPNQNALRVYNACFKSGAKYIAMLEGDDYWTDMYKLQKQVDFLEANQEFVACFHPVMVVNSNGKVLKKSKSSFVHNHDVSAEELIGGRVMSTLSLCYRNVLTEFPEEFYKSPSGDNFICSLLGNHGKGKFLSDIEPSAYRMHAQGIWSLTDESKKKVNLLLSYFWLSQYYVRIGKPHHAEKFYKKILLEGFYSNPFKGYFLGNLELVIVRSVRRMFRLIRRLLRKPASVAEHR